MENLTGPDRNRYAAIKDWVHRHLAAWEARDGLAIGETLHPNIQFILPTINWQGRSLVQTALESYLAHYSALRLHLRRLLLDPTQQVAAVEWIGRYARPGQDGCQEILGGTVLDFNQDGLIIRWRTYLDPVRQRTLANLDASLPDEGWSPCPDPGHLSYGRRWSRSFMPTDKAGQIIT